MVLGPQEPDQGRNGLVGPAADGDIEVNPDDDDTAPLPVVLPDGPVSLSVHQPDDRAPDAAEPEVRAPRIRDPFEPFIGGSPAAAPAPDPSLPDATGAAKLDQIKDLYLTAEAIGEEALTKHFQQVSDRQRQLIREYFDQVTAQNGDHPAQQS